MRTVT